MGDTTQVCLLPGTTRDLPDIERYAESLALLLIETDEFQTYLRLARSVNLDPVVSDLSEKIHYLQMAFSKSCDDQGNTIEDLYAQIDSLAIMQEYRQAEKAVRDLFRSVDQVISAATGIEFARNAHSAFT